ncbi:MAG: outer membrane protein assembly factor [Burkholderiales bacterium]|nr:outer membrane protein assembly factor [Burkholderiales bacterium]
MRFFLIGLPPALVFLLLASTAQAAALAYRVEIEAPGPIEELLKQNLGIVRWRGSDYVDKEQLDRLYAATPAEARSLLAPQGYFNPHIDTSMRTEHGEWLISLKVEPGDAAIVSDANLALSGPIRDEADFQTIYAKLIEAWLLPIGADFKQTAWDNAKRRGLQTVIIDRFPAAHIAKSHADVDPDKATADVSVEYQSGPRFTLGPVTVDGLSRYPRELVDRLQTFSPGEPYSQQKLLDFQAALQNTPYFSSVFLDVPIDESHPDQVPIKVELTEAPIYKLDAGLGYGTDKGNRASLALRDSNIRRQGWIGTFGIDLQQREQAFNAGLQFPNDADGYRNALSFQALHQDIAGQQVWQQTLGAQRTRLRGLIEVTQALQYTQSTNSTDGQPSTFTRALIPSQTWTRRELDNPNDPHSGTIFNWQIGGAAKSVLSTANFVRAYGRLAWYIPAGRDAIWLLRGEAGEVFTRDPKDVPADWLFRAGGSDSVRGYGYQTLGVQQDGAVIGGRVLATGSVEYQHRIVGNWRGAVFADAGGAADQWNSFRVSRGYGTGARWGSPVGQFAFDLAYGLDEHRIRFHFSLGVGF